jgi:ribosomal protein L7/L12
MSFLSRMMGIPDASSPTRADAAGRPRAEFNLGLLPEPDGRVLGEVQRRQMIAAIKAYREQSGAGLAEAKQVVDAIARGDRLVSGAAQAESSGARPEAAPGADTRARIDQLVIDGELIAAIQAHRAAYGVGLKEAKEAIELKRDQLGRG